MLAIGLQPELVVDNGIGGPWLRASFSTGWRRFAATHGFGGITFHGLRHGAATLLLAGGVSDAVAIKLMGHADTKILRRYQEVVHELQRDAATRMNRLPGGGLSPEVSPTGLGCADVAGDLVVPTGFEPVSPP